MHFEQLDSRTAAQAAPPPQAEPSDDEDEDESPPSKKAKLEDGIKEEEDGLLEFSDAPLPRAPQEEVIKSFRPGKRNLSVNEVQLIIAYFCPSNKFVFQARSKFERNKKNNQKNKKFSGNKRQEGPGRAQQDNRRHYNPDERNGNKNWNQFRGQNRHQQGQRGPHHQGQRGPPQEEQIDQPGPSQQQFNYDQVDYSRFQGGSKTNNKKNFHNNRGGRGGKNQVRITLLLSTH